MTVTARQRGRAVATGLTPDGVVVSTAKPLTDDWFTARREGITGTDLPKILGLSDYGNAISVWMDKRGDWDDEAGEAAMWGTELEPVVAKVWARNNDTNIAPIEMLGRRGAEWMRANLDRIVYRCPIGEATQPWGCALEVKTRNAFVAGSWRDDLPDDVLAQVAWQRMVSGYGHVHVACLIGGQRMVEHTYRKDASLETFLLSEAERVWGHVQDGTQPVADANALLTYVLDRLYPGRAGLLDLDVDKGLAVFDQIAAYEDARLAEKAAKEAREAAKAGLVLTLGANDGCAVDGRLAFSYHANKNGVRSLRIAPDLRKEYTS